MTLIGSDLTVRPYDKNDYARMATFFNLVEPDYPVTAEEIGRSDDIRDPKLEYNRFLAERGGELIGVARYMQSSGQYHPQKFYLNLHIHPEHRCQGIGSHLYNHLVAALEPFDPILLRSSAKEDQPHGVRFAQVRGFSEEDRYWESRLNPQTFDPAPYRHLDETMRSAEVEIKPFSTLIETYPDYKRIIYDLDWELEQDEPLPETPTRRDFAVYAKRFDLPDFLPEAVQIAIYKGAWRGFSELEGSEGNPKYLYNGFTAVGRELRGKGVATALKVKNLIWAKEHGYTEIKTWNNALNAPMLAVNVKLEFVRQPAEINFKKIVKEVA